MPLNEEGVPCIRTRVPVQVGTKKVPVEREVKQRGKTKTVIVYVEEPVYKKQDVLVPAEKRGWRKDMTWQHPEVTAQGQINIIEFNLNYKAFHCRKCRTNDHIRLKLIGWDWDRHRYLKHKGTGVVRRCFGCDVTTGPIDPTPKRGKKGTRKIVKRAATKEEAYAVLKKTGLTFDLSKLGY